MFRSRDVMEIVSSLSQDGKKNSIFACLFKYFKHAALFLAITSLFVILLLWYFCSGNSCLVGPSSSFRWPNASSIADFALHFKQQQQPLDQGVSRKKSSANSSSVPLSDFNIRKADVIVFLQIQNTGGSVFARHIIEDLSLVRPCVCKRKRRLCKCYRPNKKGSSWLFSRYTSGWKCGVHPDWTELTSCVDGALDEEEGKPVKRRYFYITVLRDPVKRFLSEYWNAKRGSNWKSTRHWCGGKEATAEDLPQCFDEEDIAVASLDEYLSCSYNLAINRQTRMLADLTIVNCYNRTSMPADERNLILLNSAKTNLHKMAFFGLAEIPKISSYMFETSFGMNFEDRGRPFHTGGNSAGGGDTLRREFLESVPARTIERIREINHLDVELYQYAKQLLFYRFDKLKNDDPEFEGNFDSLDKDRLASVDWAEREDNNDIV